MSPDSPAFVFRELSQFLHYALQLIVDVLDVVDYLTGVSADTVGIPEVLHQVEHCCNLQEVGVMQNTGE
jgi:hypothetical protein